MFFPRLLFLPIAISVVDFLCSRQETVLVPLSTFARLPRSGANEAELGSAPAGCHVSDVSKAWVGEELMEYRVDMLM